MNFGFVFKAIAFLVIVGGIFLAGVIAGGSFATGMVQDGVIQQVQQCMPAQTAEELRPCLTTTDGEAQP
ncbi:MULTISPECIES: hypothetical protein [Arthrobacter]|uniref:Secreted protein n=2 Tax=Arthrobacter TaxID=1663 RepID=A0ABU9KJW5_9MICC|nr:hypothetical protein [Arthrobacter sp. YJM1]MDP5226901.1 hypothetical protein [Arthrobacter sp. YJM1]